MENNTISEEFSGGSGEQASLPLLTGLSYKSSKALQNNLINLATTPNTESSSNLPLLLNNINDDDDDIKVSECSNDDKLTSIFSTMNCSSSYSLLNGSVGELMLMKLYSSHKEFSVIIKLLIFKKATLLIPATTSIDSFDIIDMKFMQDHVIFTLPIDNGGLKFVTLSGVRGFIQNNVLKVMDLISEHLPILSNNNSCHKGSKDIVEDINIKQEMDKITKLPDLPESPLEDIRSYGDDK
ncbi:4974_t:CDS:2 [Entrophospora sp. SA101]|nr:4974_t:CDS:2 [Entrophospora sp. SA101]